MQENHRSPAAETTPARDHTDDDAHVVGLVADPGMPWKLVRRLGRELEGHLAARLGAESPWRVETLQETLPVDGEGRMIMEEPARELADRRGWDTVIAVVDLPRFDHGRGVVADLIPRLRTAVVCVPALGVLRIERRLRETVLRVVEHLESLPVENPPDHAMDVDEEGADEGARDDDEETTSEDALARLTPLSDTEAGISPGSAPGGRQSERGEVSTVFVKGTLGKVRLLAGMVLANRPLRMPRDMTWTIASASAAGAYGVFFGSIWTLSSVMSTWRLAVVMALSIALLVGWLIATNGLWTRGARDEPSSRLDNLATVVTVTMACTVVYAVLFVTLGVVALVIIPVEFLSMELEAPAGARAYLHLVWLAASMGTMAGAVGSSFDDSDRIRTATYSLREQARRAGSRAAGGQAERAGSGGRE